jgi:hypothetical protein
MTKAKIPKTKKEAIKVVKCFRHFIRRMYDETGLDVPPQFQPDTEADRIISAIIAKSLGIKEN